MLMTQNTILLTHNIQYKHWDYILKERKIPANKYMFPLNYENFFSKCSLNVQSVQFFFSFFFLGYTFRKHSMTSLFTETLLLNVLRTF